MLKTLREDGFDAKLFERRGGVGGLWSYTDDKTMTTALPCGFHSQRETGPEARFNRSYV
ncbi:hypothetical protein LX36DRAFT_659669 [Colletotrichum falcatum]|nr:hypothetical protein LX36DRAFT_659669 [Colletotrichum falcatum]